MTTTATPPAEPSAGDAAVLERLSTLDRHMPAWIGLAMVVGLGLGRLLPGLDDALDRVRIDTVSLPIALGTTRFVGAIPLRTE